MFTYECFYKNKRITVQAPTSFAAQNEAAAQFKARKSWEVSVVLVARPDGTQVVHSPASL